jgi:hypothetical protein
MIGNERTVCVFRSVVMAGMALGLALALAERARATATWDGDGNVNGNWTNGLNWLGDVAPSPGTDDLIFTGATNLLTPFPPTQSSTASRSTLEPAPSS